MSTFEVLNRRLEIINKACLLFLKIISITCFFAFIYLIFAFVRNNKQDVFIKNTNTAIINPLIYTDKKSGYIIKSEKGYLIKDNLYRFENVKITNKNINIFAKRLDFYSNRNEISMKDRPFIIFNNND